MEKENYDELLANGNFNGAAGRPDGNGNFNGAGRSDAHGNFNGGIWLSLERAVRKLVIKHGDIYVVTGPVFLDMTVRKPLS